MRMNTSWIAPAVKLGLSFCFGLAATQSFAAEYIVKLKNGLDFKNSKGALEWRMDLKSIDEHKRGNLLLIDLKDESTLDLTLKIDEILSYPEVQYVVPNIEFKAIYKEPNDPDYNQQWALPKVNATQAWEIQKGSKDVVVAVIDTGIDWSHEDLKANIWQNQYEVAGNGKDDDNNGFVDDVRGWDFNGNDNDPMDETSSRNPGHGTHCAGIIGAVGDNGKGISGIAQQVTLMPIRFLGADGSGDLMAAAKAIDYAVDNGAHIISASWGAAVTRSNVSPILEAIQRAEAAGILFVAAAANDGKNNDSREVYPANAGFDNVISVAASDSNDQKPQWSNFGQATVDLASPGLNIYSTIPGNKYQNLSGTSMATPLVAGAASLIVSQAIEAGRSLKPQEIKAILQESASPVSIETACHCRIDMLSALKNVDSHRLTVVPNAATVDVQGVQSFTATGGKGPFTYSSSNEAAATINENGQLTGVAEGETIVTIHGNDGAEAESHKIFIGKASGGGGDETCPFGPLCDVLCQINPQLPWCN